MLASSNPWLRNLYLYLTRGTSSSVEWAWLIGRLAVAVIAVPTAYATLEGFHATTAIPLVGAGVVAYSVFLGWLLRRGHPKATFLVGFVLDNAVIVLVWVMTARSLGPAAPENDLWLIILPITIVGIARTGPMLGLAYVALMSGLLIWMTLAFQPAGSYAGDQLPVRLVFFGIVGALTTWLVSELNTEREIAQELQKEAEVLSEIGKVLSTSLNPADVFPQFSVLLRTLAPFEVVLLAEVNRDTDSLEILNVASLTSTTLTRGEVFKLPEDGEMMRILTRRQSQVLDEQGCIRISAKAGENWRRLIPDARSMIVSAVVSGESVIGTLFAYASAIDAFDSEHERVIARASELVGASITNMQVYSQTIQLANEREARQTLDAANRRLQEDNEARSFFLSTVSHELRTPLTSIIAFNDLLLRNKNNNLSTKELQHLGLISRNSKHLAKLVNDLLDLSYFGSSKVHISPENFSPTEAIGLIVESVSPLLKAKNQRLKWGPQTTDESIVAGRQRFIQIVENLLSNASKYSPPKSEITLDWAINDGRFQMTVRDHGSGISESDLSHLFQPFFRAAEHRTENIPGTGLGLVIVKSLLEAHGGGISVNSSQEIGDDRGTEVRIWFPADGAALFDNAGLRETA